MASYSVNERAVDRARRLIDTHQYVLESNWGEVQPGADDELLQHLDGTRA